FSGEILYCRSRRRFQLRRRTDKCDAAVFGHERRVCHWRAAVAVDQGEIFEDERARGSGYGYLSCDGRCPAEPERRHKREYKDDLNKVGALHRLLPRASSRIRRDRDGLNTPHEQNRARYADACSGVRRPSFTQSIIFLASDMLIIP